MSDFKTEKWGSNVGSSELTRSEATIQAYLKRGDELWNRASKELGIEPDYLSPLQYIEWIKKLLVTLRPSSKRQYIAAAREHLKTMPEKSYEFELALKVIMMMQGKDYFDPICQKIKEPKTSSHKAKHINLNKFIHSCKEEMKSGKSKWTLPALTWLSANVFVGLRPCEWRYAELLIVDSKTILKVRNAKATNGRSHGELRHIDITSFCKTRKEFVKKQLRIIANLEPTEEAWNSYYNSIRRKIYSLVRKVGKFQNRYPTLYSARHQYAADAKSAGLDLNSIAALMGHATNETVKETYGKKRHGSGQFSAKPDTNEVSKVRFGKPRKVFRKKLTF